MRISERSSQSPAKARRVVSFKTKEAPETVARKRIGSLCWWAGRMHCKIPNAIFPPNVTKRKVFECMALPCVLHSPRLAIFEEANVFWNLGLLGGTFLDMEHEKRFDLVR